MNTLIKIEEDIENLNKKEFIELREWFQDLDSKKWDEQIDDDIKSGKLDELANAAISDFNNKKYKAI